MQKRIDHALACATLQQFKLIKDNIGLNGETLGPIWSGLIGGGFSGALYFQQPLIGAAVVSVLGVIGNIAFSGCAVNSAKLDALRQRKAILKEHKSWGPYHDVEFEDNKEFVQQKHILQRAEAFRLTKHYDDPCRQNNARRATENELAQLTARP